MLAFLSVLLLLVQKPADPPLGDVLASVERYVVDYEPRLSHCVAREVYVQQTTWPTKQVRRLESDFLFLRARDGDSWMGVRNVTGVNGRELPGRDDDRLRAIASATPAEALKLASEVAKQNAQYNVGVERTVNVPNLLLGWLREDVRPRLRFRHGGRERLRGRDLLRIDFNETTRPTLIQSHHADLVSSGSFWVDPVTGRVWQTELRNGTRAASYLMRVQYEFEPRLEILVPVKMEESISGAVSQRGDATYTNYRRFGVTSRIK